MSIVRQIAVYNNEQWNINDIGAKAENISLATSVANANNVQSALHNLVGENRLESNKVVITDANGILTTNNDSIDIFDLNLVNGSVEGSLRTKTSQEQSNEYKMGKHAIALGFGTIARGTYSFAEGADTEARESGSHAQGSTTIARGLNSHAEGANTEAVGQTSHAEGQNTLAFGNYSHAEGIDTQANGHYSHAEGNSSVASGLYSHAQNHQTVATRASQTTIGVFNILDTEGQSALEKGKYALIIGNGSSNAARSNAFAVDWTGNIDMDLDVDSSASSSTAATSGEDMNLFNAIRSLGWYNDVIS